MTELLCFHFSLSCIGERNGNPFQCSCPENPRDGGAWWDAVYGVAQSRPRLKQLSSSSSSRREKGSETIFEEIVAENFMNTGKEIVNQVQEVQRVPSRINPRRYTPNHIVIELTHIKDKDKILKATSENDK